MQHLRYIILFSMLVNLSAFSQSPLKHQDKNERLKIAAEMKESMVNKLLRQWYPQSVDSTFGGFLSTFSYDFKPVGNQDKMIVTQARHTWTNAKAAEMFPDTTYFKSDARHGVNFLKNVMWDKPYGGFYTFIDRQGNVKSGSFAPKEAYGNSFAIYALAAYYQQSGDTNALGLAKKAFKWLENHSHDPIYKGYYQHMERDGTPIKRNDSVPSTAELGYKDQNSSIHLLESFTELYTVWPDSLLGERLKEILFLIRDIITTDRGNLVLFFKPDWTPISYKDSSQATILKHRGLDHVSFGHDVETAYLMLEASHVLGLENDTTTMHIAKKMVDHSLANGWDDKVGGFYDEGYYFTAKPSISIIADTKNWWAQAEGLNTLLMMSDFYPNDRHEYYGKFKMLWNYAQTYLIDQEHGDWYSGGLDKEPQQKTALKGHIWKATYHSFRALMNCIQRLDPDKIPPSAPANVKLETVKNSALLKWDRSKDDKILLGYNIYRDGDRIGYTPLTYFSLLDFKQKNGSTVSIKSIDLQGNESSFSKTLSY
ncbi:MAG: AGE family epimerase/isomerase [Ginsengibacter sp.]